MISIIERQKERLLELCRTYRVKRLELFGSAMDSNKFNLTSSDLDFIVEFEPMTPIEHAKAYFDLLEKLQDLFERDIDLLEIKAICNPYLLESINETRSTIYAA